MADKVKIDAKVFLRRINTLFDSWKNKDNEHFWKNSDALAIAVGATDEDKPYKKSSALQSWLLGYEFVGTIIVMCEKNVYFLTSTTKAQMLDVIQKTAAEDKSELAIHFLNLNKADANKESLDALIAAIKNSKTGKSIGMVVKDKVLGELGKQWEAALGQSGLVQNDVTLGFSDVLSIKDARELKCLKTAGELTVKIMKDHFIPKMEVVIDEGKVITHEKLADSIEELFETPEKISSDISPNEMVETCYTPIVQSGGVYDLKLSATNDKNQLHFGTIVASMGARFRGYCSNIARTFLVNPEKEQEAAYKVLLEVHQMILKALKPGAKISEIVDRAIKLVEKKDPALSEKFLTACGYGIGIEFQETYSALNAKNTRPIKSGMVFNVLVGFQNLSLKTNQADPKKKVYSLLLSDTVAVTDAEPIVLTSGVKNAYKDVAYFLEDDEAPAKEVKKESPVKKEKQKQPAKNVDDDVEERGAPVVLDGNRIRENKGKPGKSDIDQVKRHQKELAELKQKEQEARIMRGESSSSANANSGAKGTDVVAYKDPAQFPADASKNKVSVDIHNESVLLPIYGFIVPFHISTIKNANKNEDYLRINFNTPSATTIPGNNTVYIKEVTYRMNDANRLNTCLRHIKELRKRVTERETEMKEKNSLKVQGKLQLNKSGVRPPRLPDLYIRPSLTGKRSSGTLEAHVNGFRFTSNKSASVDILYKNIKYAFFQPHDQELIILIHFRLHDAIMMGKKKTIDVQFYAEAMEASQHLDNSHRRDVDEIDDENREAAMRAKLNKDFQVFIKKVEEIAASSNLEFDIPYRELGFFGVPGRSNVFIQPSVHCLVSIVETPFFILGLSEVEVCHFERIQFGLRNFDIVFIYKDYSAPVSKINNISIEYLDPIKEWMDSCNIKFYEGPTNLNWPRIMAAIRDDPQKFVEDGGWKFLEPDSEEEGGADDDGSEEGSDYAPAESDESSEEYSSNPSSEDGSDDSDSDEGEEESEEEGLDWDEHEKRAMKADRERGQFVEDEKPKSKRKRTGEYSDDEEPQAKKSNVQKASSSAKKPSAPPAKRPAAAPAKKR